MRQNIRCAFCGESGDGATPGYYSSRFLLGVRLNSRTLKKGWACRECITKHSKLSDRDFLQKFEKAILKKS